MVAPSYDPSRSEAVVLEAIRRTPGITRAEIADRTNLTRGTVTNTVNELMRRNLVEESGKRITDRGQPPIELRIRPNTGYTIGVHHAYRLINVAVTDIDGTILWTDRATLEPGDPVPTIDRIAEVTLANIARLEQRKQHLVGVGFATFGPIDLAAGTVSPPIYGEAWQHQPLRRMLADRIGQRVWMDNDATCATIGEFWYGDASIYDDFLHVYFGYGLGGGMFLGGRVRRGASFNAGEVGHVIVDSQGSPWFHGPAGSFESEASLLRLERDLGAPPPHDRDVFALERPEVNDWFDRAGVRLAQVAASSDHLLDLEAIVVGGLLHETSLQKLVHRANIELSRFGIGNRPQRAELLTGTTGPYSAALGAAMLPVYDSFLPSRSAVMPNERAFSIPG